MRDYEGWYYVLLPNFVHEQRKTNHYSETFLCCNTYTLLSIYAFMCRLPQDFLKIQIIKAL